MSRATYYPIAEKLAELARDAGYDIKEVKSVERETVNRKEDICVPRIFVQAKLSKPLNGMHMHTNQ